MRVGYRRILLGILGTSCTLIAVAWVVARAAPITAATWIAVGLCALSGATLALKGTGRRLFWLGILSCTYLLVPRMFQFIPGIEVCILFDNVGGRSAYEISPGLRFGTHALNTALLQRHVGELEPQWRHAFSMSPYIRDGNERVHSRNIIHRAYFHEVLEMLPHDEARRGVIESLVEPENRLRVHQGLLLTCLYCLDYPPGTDSSSWWSQHSDFFYVERNPVIAASITQGWCETVSKTSSARLHREISSQLRAVIYQERGQWGGHADFGCAFQEVELGSREPDPTARALGRQVVWWPAHHAK